MTRHTVDLENVNGELVVVTGSACQVPMLRTIFRPSVRIVVRTKPRGFTPGEKVYVDRVANPTTEDGCTAPL